MGMREYKLFLKAMEELDKASMPNKEIDIILKQHYEDYISYF